MVQLIPTCGPKQEDASKRGWQDGIDGADERVDGGANVDDDLGSGFISCLFLVRFWPLWLCSLE